MRSKYSGYLNFFPSASSGYFRKFQQEFHGISHDQLFYFAETTKSERNFQWTGRPSPFPLPGQGEGRVKVDMRREEDKCEKYSNAVLVQKQYWQSVNDLLKGGCHRARSRREIHVTGGGRDASSEVEGSGSPSGRRVRTSRRRSAASGRRPTATVKDHENFYRLACKLSGGSNIGP